MQELLQYQLSNAFSCNLRFHEWDKSDTKYPLLYEWIDRVYCLGGPQLVRSMSGIFNINTEILQRRQPVHVPWNTVYLTQVINYMNLDNHFQDVRKDDNIILTLHVPNAHCISRVHFTHVSSDGQVSACEINFCPTYNVFVGLANEAPDTKYVLKLSQNSANAAEYLRSKELATNVIVFIAQQPQNRFVCPIAHFHAGNKGDWMAHAERLHSVQVLMRTCRNCILKWQELKGKSPLLQSTDCPFDPGEIICKVTCKCEPGTVTCLCPCDSCHDLCEFTVTMCNDTDGETSQQKMVVKNGDVNALLREDPMQDIDNMQQRNLSKIVCQFDPSHYLKTVKNALTNNCILIESSLLNTRMLFTQLDDKVLLGEIKPYLSRAAIDGEDRMNELYLKQLFLCAPSVYDGLFFWTSYPSIRGEKLSKWIPIHGPILFIVSSPFNDDFVLALQRKKSKNTEEPVPAATASINEDLTNIERGEEMDDSARNSDDHSVQLFGSKCIYRISRGARSEPVLLCEAQNAIALIIMPTSRKSDIIVLNSKKTESIGGTNLYILEQSLSNGSPNSRSKSKLTMLNCTMEPVTQSVPLIISLAFYPGQPHGIAVSETNWLYEFNILCVKKSKKSPESKSVKLTPIGAAGSKFGKINHIAIRQTLPDISNIFLASTTGIFEICSKNLSDLQAFKCIFPKPTIFVGVTASKNVYCILSTGLFYALEGDVTVTQALDCHSYKNSCLKKSSVGNISPCFGVVEDSIVLADGNTIRILSSGSALKSVLNMGLLFLQAYGYLPIDGRKDIKLPDGVKLLTVVMEWYNTYEKKLQNYASKFGIKSVVGMCSTDGALTAPSRVSIKYQFMGLNELLRRYYLLGIANKIHMASITEVKNVFSIYCFL